MGTRCWWCAWPAPAQPGDPRLIPLRARLAAPPALLAPFCDASCAAAYARQHDAPEALLAARAALELPADEVVVCAPAPQPYAWWTAGGVSRTRWADQCAAYRVVASDGGEAPPLDLQPPGGLWRACRRPE